MFRSGISTFRELEELEANALRDGALAQKYKELIALGISISHGCYG
jgi:alkylhydroperoxidase/carboxymuconolactone decarboxylase family protein YurZ